MFWLTAAEELLLKTTQTLCKLICHPLTKRLNVIILLVSMRISSLLHFNVSGVTLRSNDVSECHEQWNHVTIHTVIKFMMHATFTVESTLMMCCVFPEPDNIYTTATYVIHCLVWFQLLVCVNCFGHTLQISWYLIVFRLVCTLNFAYQPVNGRTKEYIAAEPSISLYLNRFNVWC